MELIGQNAKQIMEECKKRARSAGLRFNNETLEYIATNQDLVSLSPKGMIPTLYDYWIHDVEILQGEGVYKVYPHNPFETVINTRPAISFYNDNNPDWLNVMIFYHVLGHIDCFQNNVFFQKTWGDDFCGQALAGKRLLNKIREELGEEKRWVDYVVEFTRGIDNLVGFHAELNHPDDGIDAPAYSRTDFYFGEFLNGLYQKNIITTGHFAKDLERYNRNVKQLGPKYGENAFFEEVTKTYPEFLSLFEKFKKEKKSKPKDIIEYLAEHSEFLAKSQNAWMKQVMQVVRQTSLFFQPQIRTKILNEGWASFWHQKLFLQDERISGHEVGFAKINSDVMQMPRIGINPYTLGCWLLEFIENLAEKGKLSYAFQNIKKIELRNNYNANLGKGAQTLFHIRTNLDDFGLINFLSDDDFQDFVNIHRLFVAGSFIDPIERKKHFYVKSRNGQDYRKMVLDSLYHPPHITIDESSSKNGELYLKHQFEGRMLIAKYIPAVLIGLQFLWGNKVKLETTELEYEEQTIQDILSEKPNKYKKIRVVYTIERDEIDKTILEDK